MPPFPLDETVSGAAVNIRRCERLVRCFLASLRSSLGFERADVHLEGGERAPRVAEERQERLQRHERVYGQRVVEGVERARGEAGGDSRFWAIVVEADRQGR